VYFFIRRLSQEDRRPENRSGGAVMPNDQIMFWLIHLFLGIVLPYMILVACNWEDEDKKVRSASAGD